MVKLTEEDKYNLGVVLDETYLRVLFKVIDQVVEDMQAQVIRHNLDTKEAEHELLYRKLRAEGAARAALNFKRDLNSRKKKTQKPVGGVTAGGKK